MITKEQIAEWRKLKNEGMVSCAGEYAPPEFWEALDEIERLKRKVSEYHRLYQQANGKVTRYERTRDRLAIDKIFLKRKIWAILAVLPDEANWHNAPDYIRHFKSQMSAHAKQANHYQKLYNELNAKSKNSMGIENVQGMAHSIMTMFAPTVTQEYANKFIEEWRRNNDC